MKKWTMVLLGVLALTGGALMAADLSNGSGQSCGTATGVWHFVNNQTGGAAPGSLTATFTSGTCTTPPSAVNQNTQHFFCTASGALIDAETNLPGRLVLSDFSCGEKEEPPCDPEKDPDCKP